MNTNIPMLRKGPQMIDVRLRYGTTSFSMYNNASMMSICILCTIKYTMQFLLVSNSLSQYSSHPLSYSNHIASSHSFHFDIRQRKTFIFSWKMCHGSPTCSVFIGAVLLQLWSCRLSYLALNRYNINKSQNS